MKNKLKNKLTFTLITIGLLGLSKATFSGPAETPEARSARIPSEPQKTQGLVALIFKKMAEPKREKKAEPAESAKAPETQKRKISKRQTSLRDPMF
jgi:hypothetical protein